MAVEGRLTGLLRDARDWERRATNIPGVFLLKLPSSRTRQAAIAIESNPVDSAGSATKKRGIVANLPSSSTRTSCDYIPCHNIGGFRYTDFTLQSIAFYDVKSAQAGMAKWTSIQNGSFA
ncbi:MAG: hypothetical protein WBZ36_01015 [Candidatus Nitrosopolaris sp.]